MIRVDRCINMRITQEVYEYVFIKLTVLKNLIMNSEEIERMNSYTDLVSLFEFCKNFYPGLNPSEKSVVALEKNLWDIYFQIVEKIIYASPTAIERFVKAIMIRFEVWNIKIIILSMII
jgi:vacuolar-type H+-ATPase subunit C/Vma6